MTTAIRVALVTMTILLTVSLAAGAPAQTNTVPPAITLTQVAGPATPIPGGTGSFTVFSPNPAQAPNASISFGNVAFFAAGSAGQQGIYVAVPPGPPARIADLNTAIPAGDGNFAAFSLDSIHPPGPCISGSNLVWTGAGAGGQQGIYVAIPPGPPAKIADLNTAVPGGTGNFTSFALDPAHPPGPCISGGAVVFMAFGAAGQQGIYVAIPPGPPGRIADLNTAIPNGQGNFTAFSTGAQQSSDFNVVGGFTALPPGPPCISGRSVAFIASGAGGQKGIYLYSPGSPARVADASTAIPGQPGSVFASFGNVSVNGTSVAFTGSSVSSALGIQSGVYVASPPGPPNRVADASTLVPGGFGNFLAFGNVAIDADKVVFEGLSNTSSGTPQKGLYLSAGSVLTRIVDLSDMPGGRTLSGLHLGPDGFSGAQIVFSADFSDGSQGIFLAQIGGNHCAVGQGFWKNHPTQWPVGSLAMGSQTYSRAELLGLLKTSPENDASLILARQLITAKLNAANGADLSGASSAIVNADALLSGFAGKLPFHVKSDSAIGVHMTMDAAALTQSNEGGSSPHCIEGD